MRIMVACAPKSASTYVANVLGWYFSIEFGARQLVYYYEWEQNLTPDVIEQINPRANFVLQMHLLPHRPNLIVLDKLQIKPIFLWRNLADTVISYDDHIRTQSHEWPNFYIHNRNWFLAQPDQARYQFLIQRALPWHLAFYLGWRARDATFRHYENMLRDETAYFRGIIQELAGGVDVVRLKQVLDEGKQVRFNVGTWGRSKELFSSATRLALENLILNDPWHEQLEVLLDDLPWKATALGSSSALDGRVFRAPANEAYYVSRGMRHRIKRASWILSHPDGLSCLEDCAVADLVALPEGMPLE